MRYVKFGGPLGSGQFGTVYKAINVDSGKFMALKILQRPTRTPELVDWEHLLYYALKREVEALSEINHVSKPFSTSYAHETDIRASHTSSIISRHKAGTNRRVKIFMGLKEGTLESLIESGANVPVVATTVFPQMLQALDHIAWKGIVHRDVKPENILYVSQSDGEHCFQLGDFGLCNRIVDATTFAGSRLYMPPEIFREGYQTHKVDVWSLFVTMLWTLDAGDFRSRSNQFQYDAEVQRAVLSAASNVSAVSKIREMAIVNPEKRASAAQMLVKHFDGVGLSTP